MADRIDALPGVVSSGAGRFDDQVDGFERRIALVGALVALTGTDDDGRAGVETRRWTARSNGRRGLVAAYNRRIDESSQRSASPSDPTTPASS